MEKMTTQMYTVFLLMGPSNCGKSTFSPILKEKLLEVMKDSPEKARINYISSDDLRLEILGQELHKYDEEMDRVSSQAFNLLYAKLDLVTSYPANNHFVIVDSTGLNEEFRQKVKEICEKNQYNLQLVVFDYSREDYFWDSMTNDEKRVTGKHVDKFKLSEIAKISKFKSTRFSKRVQDLEVKVSDYELFSKTFFTPQKPVAVVQDIHGCMEEFMDLLHKMGVGVSKGKITTSPYLLVVIGDYIDKGKFSREVLKFIYENKEWFSIIIGNHEKFVVHYLKGDKSYLNTDESIVKNNFDTVYLFDEEDKKMLFELFDQSLPFYRTKNFILTHAPVEVKYLGKLDSLSIKRQINTPHMKQESHFSNEEDYVDYLEKNLMFLNQSDYSFPIHVFGHKTFKSVFRAQSRIGIDTGCFAGGHLTAVVLEGSKTKMFSVKAKEVYKESKLINIFQAKEELSEEEKYRSQQIASNKVNIVSGTVSPSDKTNNSLESLESAFDYYRKKGLTELILQKKYMGSRCNVYLSLDVDQCFSVSRNGYRVKKDLTKVYESLLDLYKEDMIARGVTMKIIDSELMPWSFMGRGLIDKTFKVVSKGVNQEINLLKSSGFEEKFNEFKNEVKKVDFKQKINTLKKDEVVKEIGKSKYDSMMASLSVKEFSLKEMSENISIYDRQMDLYSTEADPYVLPFALLKEIFIDGTEKVYVSDLELTKENFEKVSKDEYFIVNTQDPESVLKAKAFYDRVTLKEGCEGVMVKPPYTYHKGVAPMIKVRNPEYLSIIYGYDYKTQDKFNKLIENKSIGGKLKSSIKEYEIGRKMLMIPFSAIGVENKAYMSLVEDVVREETREMKYDPRL